MRNCARLVTRHTVILRSFRSTSNSIIWPAQSDGVIENQLDNSQCGKQTERYVTRLEFSLLTGERHWIYNHDTLNLEQQTNNEAELTDSSLVRTTPALS